MKEQAQGALQARVTTFIIILSVLLIAAFTTVQIKNQMKAMGDHNRLMAKVSTPLVKSMLEGALYNAEEGADLGRLLSEELEPFVKGELIETGSVIAEPNEIIASSDPSQLGKNIPPEEAAIIKGLFKEKERSKRMASHIDKSTMMLFTYLPITSGDSEPYVVRVVFSLGNFTEAMAQVYIPIIVTALIVLGVGIGFGFMLSKSIIGPIGILNEATQYIASGNLDMRVDMPTGDELEELAGTFNHMTVALKRMKERAENANPLTKLPGNNVIHENVENRIKRGEKFVVVHTDLDNFKAFNDKYGINNGDKAIMITSQILQQGLKDKGDSNDFIGHEGGDDFVFVTTPEKADEVTSYMISEFDRQIRVLYSEEDLKKGCIIAKGRDDVAREYPIMSVSLSGVTNAVRPITSYAEITNIVAEVKKKTKAVDGSVFLVDKRSADRGAVESRVIDSP